MPAIYCHSHVVRDDEIDGLGHVNNLHYLKWMQDAAVAHSAAQGWPTRAIPVDRGGLCRAGPPHRIPQTRVCGGKHSKSARGCRISARSPRSGSIRSSGRTTGRSWPSARPTGPFWDSTRTFRGGFPRIWSRRFSSFCRTRSRERTAIRAATVPRQGSWTASRERIAAGRWCGDAISANSLSRACISLSTIGCQVRLPHFRRRRNSSGPTVGVRFPEPDRDATYPHPTKKGRPVGLWIVTCPASAPKKRTGRAGQNLTGIGWTIRPPFWPVFSAGRGTTGGSVEYDGVSRPHCPARLPETRPRVSTRHRILQSG